MSSDQDLKRSFVASVMQFLTDELKDDSLTADSKDSIEVALQCLETAYSINPVDGTLPSKKPIIEIFSSHMQNQKEETKKTLSESDKAKANDLKNQGNELMKNAEYQEALEAYTKAIEIDNSNPIYYCNRAAAYSKLENHHQALEDCKVAIKHDPKYSKAYCRMGLAFVQLNDYQRACDSYRKAVELDPSESNVNNLRLAEQKLQEEQSQYGGLGNFNLGNILNNPQFMTMASQMMSDPKMQNMFSQLMGGGGSGAATNPSQDSESDNGQQSTAPPLNGIMQMGQQFAEQMKAMNPELIEQLQSAMGKKPPSNDENPK